MKLKHFCFALLTLLLVSCGEYNKILKSTDVLYKFEHAKTYFEAGKYTRSATLLEDVVPVLRTSQYGEEALYLLAQSYYNMKDYFTASEYFKTYTTAFPRGEYSELARYYSAYCLYKESPDPRLDQADTYRAMQLFQEFLELYPQSDRKEDVHKYLFELQEKLALKELMAVRLYYNLGDYILYPFPGGNYQSCVITAQNALRLYSLTKYREDFMYYVFLSKYEMAVQSVEEKKDFRYRDVIDEYFAYANEFPEGKYVKEVNKLYANVMKAMND